MCEDIAGGSKLLAAVTFFREIQRPFRWVLDVRWRNHYFARNKEAFPTTRNLLIRDGTCPSQRSGKLSWVPMHDGHDVRPVYRVII